MFDDAEEKTDCFTRLGEEFFNQIDVSLQKDVMKEVQHLHDAHGICEFCSAAAWVLAVFRVALQCPDLTPPILMSIAFRAFNEATGGRFTVEEAIVSEAGEH